MLNLSEPFRYFFGKNFAARNVPFRNGMFVARVTARPSLVFSFCTPIFLVSPTVRKYFHRKGQLKKSRTVLFVFRRKILS